MRLWPSVVLALCALSCNDELVEDVPPEECVSGHRWVGGKRGSEEMFPGEDCVGCHLENDGPQLMAGGTVYAVQAAAITRMGGQPQAKYCFGVEGVEVTIIGSDLEELKTTSNRAGNFYFEGRPSELAKPFTVKMTYNGPLGMGNPQMIATNPSYGGCARCHTPGIPATMYNNRPPPEAQLSQANDYIDLALRVSDFLDLPAAAADDDGLPSE